MSSPVEQAFEDDFFTLDGARLHPTLHVRVPADIGLLKEQTSHDDVQIMLPEDRQSYATSGWTERAVYSLHVHGTLVVLANICQTNSMAIVPGRLVHRNAETVMDQGDDCGHVE